MTIQTSDLPLQLKQAMRRMAASVSIISTHGNNGQAYAMTATAVTSVALHPPSLLVCVNRQAGIYAALEQGQPFYINILNSRQRDLAELCSQGPETRDRFAAGHWQTDAHGIPYLQDAQANILCLNDKSLCYASHTIFIGRVKNVTLHGEVCPLIYLDGTYRAASLLQDTDNQASL